MIATLFIILVLGLVFTVPIALSLALASGVYLLLYMSHIPEPLAMLAQPFITSADSFALMAVPFFMLAGTLMSKGGIAKKLINVADAVAGPVFGGLGVSTVVACMFFAAISGSGPATVAAIGSIMIPAMNDRGYDESFSAALTATAGGIGVIIPPSIPMIVYGAIMGVSVSKIFLAGFLPGIIVGLGLIIVTYIISKKRGYKGIPRGGGLLWVLKVIWDAKFAIIMPVIILGGIYGGVFTPTEAAAVATVYALIIGVFVYKTLTFKRLIECLTEAAVLSAIVMVLLGGALTFGRLLTLQRVPDLLASTMLSFTSNPIVILLLINLLLLITGCFIDTISNVILLAPLLVPIVVKVGVDPVHFGVVMVVNLAIGFISPPLGMNLFVASGITGVPFEDIVKSILPFFLITVVSLLIITYVPSVSMFLPKLLGY